MRLKHTYCTEYCTECRIPESPRQNSSNNRDSDPTNGARIAGAGATNLITTVAALSGSGWARHASPVDPDKIARCRLATLRLAFAAFAAFPSELLRNCRGPRDWRYLGTYLHHQVLANARPIHASSRTTILAPLWQSILPVIGWNNQRAGLLQFSTYTASHFIYSIHTYCIRLSYHA